MAGKIEVKHELWDVGHAWSHFVTITMTNDRGTTYQTHVFKESKCRLLGPGRVTNAATGVSIRTCSAPKWVQRTITEQLPIIAIMLS
jgi:hypothetical protein